MSWSLKGVWNSDNYIGRAGILGREKPRGWESMGCTLGLLKAGEP